MDGPTVVAMVGGVGGLIVAIQTVAMKMLSNFKRETNVKLSEISADVKAINLRVYKCEQEDARSVEWRAGHADLVDRCQERFDTLDRDIRDLRESSKG